jgi:hypothetical protein
METTPLPLGIIFKVVFFGIPGLIWLILAIRRRKARKDAEQGKED